MKLTSLIILFIALLATSLADPTTECVRLVTLAGGNNVPSNFMPEQHGNLLCEGTIANNCEDTCVVVDCGYGCKRGLLETLTIDQILDIEAFYITHPHNDHFSDLPQIQNWWPVQYLFKFFQSPPGPPPFAVPPMRYVANLESEATLMNLLKAYETDIDWRNFPVIFNPIHDLYNSTYNLQELAFAHGTASAWEVKRSHFNNQGENFPSSAFAFQFPWMTIAFTGDGAFQEPIDNLLRKDEVNGYVRNSDVLVANSRPARGSSNVHMSANEVAPFAQTYAVGELVLTHGLPVAEDPNPPFPLLPPVSTEEYLAGTWDGGYWGKSTVSGSLREHRWANMRITGVELGRKNDESSFELLEEGEDYDHCNFNKAVLRPLFDNTTDIGAITRVLWDVAYHGSNFSTSDFGSRETTNDGLLKLKKVGDEQDGTWTVTATPCTDEVYDDPAGEYYFCGIPYTVTVDIEFD